MSPSLIDFDVLLDRAAAAREREGMPIWTEFESAACWSSTHPRGTQSVVPLEPRRRLDRQTEIDETHT